MTAAFDASSKAGYQDGPAPYLREAIGGSHAQFRLTALAHLRFLHCLCIKAFVMSSYSVPEPPAVSYDVLLEYVGQHLGDGLLPELRRDLLQLATHDAQQIGRNRHWTWVIPTLQHVLHGESQHITPFLAAWGFMYAVTVRLDHLQDHDPVENPLPIAQSNAQYNLIFAYYVLATSLLDDLSPLAIPAHRILRVRRLWSDMVLRMASGQHRDLTGTPGSVNDAFLEYYQHIAQAKTGSAFALAFGGTATLLSDDVQFITTMTLVGEIFGALVQYNDDVLDAAAQSNPTLTLPGAFQHAYSLSGLAANTHTAPAFWAYIYQAYRAHISQLIKDVPSDVQAGILLLFADAFEHPRLGDATTRC
jgi:hypothetical protein